MDAVEIGVVGDIDVKRIAGWAMQQLRGGKRAGIRREIRRLAGMGGGSQTVQRQPVAGAVDRNRALKTLFDR